MTQGKFPNGLQKAMDLAAVGPTELARAIGSTKQDISRWAKQERRLQPEDAMKLAPHLNTTADRLLLLVRDDPIYDPRDPADPEPIPIETETLIGSEMERQGTGIAQLDVTAGLGAGGTTLVLDGVPGRGGMTFAAEYVAGYWALPDQAMAAMALRARDTIVLPVQGNSMAPTLLEGDFVFIDTRHRTPSPDGVYAVEDAFGGIIIKTLRAAPIREADDPENAPFVDIVSDNPDKDRYPTHHLPATQLRVIGRVVRRFSAVF